MTASPHRLTLEDRMQCSNDVLVQEVGGEAVLLDLASEKYFGLDPVGTRIWALLADHDSLRSVADVLCAEYDAEPARIRDDLLTLVGKLADAGLVTVA